MEEQDKLRGFYDALKSNSNISGIPEEYEQFKSVLADKKKAEPFYENLKSSGVVSGLPNDFESFSTILPQDSKNEVPDINVLRKDYNDFMSQNKDFLDSYRKNEKRLLDLSPTPIGVPFMLSSLFKTDKQREEDNRYRELSAREEELSQAISTHPETLGKKKILMDSIDESIGELDAMMQERRKNIPVSYANTSIGGVVMGEGSDLELSRLDAANKMYKDAKELLKAPSKFDDSNPFMNFMKGAGDTFNDRDFWSFGLTEIGRNLKMKSIFKKVAENSEGKDLDKILSPGEQKMFEAFTALSSVEAERAKDLALGYSAGEGAAESLKFMAEFIATGGVASAASSGAKKAVSKWLIQNTKNGLMRELGKGLAWGTEAGLSTLARTPLMPSTYANITNLSNQFETDENGETLLDENGNPVLKSGWKVFRDGFVDSFIENVSEMSGPHLAGILGIGGKIAGKALPKKVKDVFDKAGDVLSKSQPGEIFSRISKSPVYKFLKQGGYNGLLEEWGEEWYGAALRSVLTDPSALKDYATVENQLVTIASFLPMSVFGGGAAAGQMMRAKGKYNTTLSALQGLMNRLGYNADQVAYLTDQIESASAQKMSSTVAPIINNLALENEEMAGELFKAVSDFAKAKGDYYLLNGAYQERMAERRADEDRRMESETGGYVNMSTGNVEIVSDREGNTAYVVGETLDDGHKVYILNKGGEKVPVSREDFEEEYTSQGTFGKDEFLGNIIMSRDLEEEAVSETEAMNEEEAISETGNGVSSMASYQGRPVQVVEGTEMEDGTVIVEDESGETMRVPVGDLEVNDVSTEEPGVEVQEGDGVVQSEEDSRSEIPRTKDGMPDYDSMSPEMFAVEFEREFGADAARSELVQMSADIDAQIEKLQKKSLTNRNERAENMREIARLKGEQESIRKAMERYAVPDDAVQDVEPVFSNEEEATRWVIENSDDVNEVLGTYESVKGLQKDVALPRWQQELQGIKINPESFYKEGDRNLTTPELKRGWLSRNGRNIDEVAHDLSNYGIEVTPQNIVDFMLENPSGLVRQKNSELDALGQRFAELATKAAGVKIGKPDSPTGKLFIENLRTSNDMEQLRNQINDAQRAEEEVLRSMAEQRDAEKGRGDDDIKPIGQGFFGNIYDQFRGRAKDAIDFLMNRKEGEAIGALHHPQVGDIDLVWGNDKAGLMKIAKKHPEMLDDLQGKIDNMEVVSSSDNRIVLESPTDKAVVSKNVFDEEGKQWLLTAYEKKNADISGSSIDIEPEPEGKQNGTAPLQNESVSSAVKDTESLGENQEADVYSESIKAAEAAVDVSPTQAQKDAGNYKKGHIKLDGYDITIENPKGSERSGVDADGNPWSTKMNNTYGYIRGTKGVDGDHIDVFLSDTPQGGNVYVVDQVKEDGTFDEHKVVYGFSSLDEARDAYLSNYSPGWKGLGAITEVSKDEFKKWVDSSKRKTKPFSEYKNVKVEGSQIDSPLFRSIDNNTEEEQEIIDRNRQDGVSATDNTGEFSRGNDDIRFREVDDAYVSSFAEKYGVSDEDVKKYAQSMKMGKSAGAFFALQNMKREIMLGNNIKSLGEFTKLFTPIKAELYKRFGNVDVLREENVRRAKESQNVMMEAARKKAEEEAAAERKRLEEFELMSDEQLDAEYFKAIENNNEGRIRDLVNEAARRKGYVSSDEFRMSHRAPSYDEEGIDKSMVDVANNRDQIRESLDEQLRMNRDRNRDESAEAINKALSAIDRGEKPTVTIYRAVPKSLKEGKVRNGDWVTFSKSYAKQHGNHALGGDYRIMSEEVPAENLYWDGNDINEWGYDDRSDYRYRDTKNNRKLNDLITRDDAGNVIPLSERFNSRKDDVRYRFIGEKGAANLDKAEEATTRLDNLNVAREMEKGGKDAKSIKLATGWERGADGKWRYETRDSKLKDTITIQGNTFKRYEDDMLWTSGKLGDVVDDNELFDAYPELADVHLETDSMTGEMLSNGSYNPKTRTIHIHASELKYLNSLLNHEIQHAIQNIEGFERGGNPMILYPFGSKNILANIEEANEFIEKYGDDFLLQARKGDDKDFSSNSIFIIKSIGRNKKKMTALDGRLALMDLYIKNGDIKPIGFSGYKRLSGEVEARNAQRRINMTPEERRNSLASETEDVAREDQIFLSDALGVSASMESNSIDDVNRLFNEELEQQVEGKLPKGHVYQLGRPGNVLKRAGIPDLPIEMASARLLHKSNQENHPFDLSEVKNLPQAVQNPIAVFRSATHIGSNVILTELKQGNKNFVVAIQTNKDKGKIQINDIRSIHPRTTSNIVSWINEGLMDYANIGNLKEWLSDKIKTKDYLNSSNPAEVRKSIVSAANIVENFENPTLLEGEISSTIDGLSDELGVKVNKVKSRNDLPEGIQRQMKNGRYPGLFDPKTGEVYMVMDEITDVSDAQATMLHEILGHKGIRGLFGDRIGEFTNRVLDSMPESEREAWVKKYNGNEQLAAEEYVARFAEGYENPSAWEKIKAVIRDLLRDLGIDLRLSDNDLKYTLWRGVRSMQQDGTFMGASEYTAKDREVQRALFREESRDNEFTDSKLNLGERTREAFQDRMLSVKMLLDEVKKRGGKVTDYANPYVAENMATSKSKAQIDDFNKRLWTPLMDYVKEFTDKGKTREDIDRYMMAKHAPERNALLKERDGVENGSGMTDTDAAKIVTEFEKDFGKDYIESFWNNVREATRFTTDTWRRHGLIDKATKDYYDNMYQYYVPLRGWETSEADNIEYLDGSRKGGSMNVNKRAKGRSSLADSPLAYIANMAHSAIVAGNKNDVKRNVFEMMALNKNPDLYHLRKVYHVNTGTNESPVWIEQLEKPAAEFWKAGKVKVEENRRNDAKREYYKTKQHQVEVFVNGQKYIMEFNGNMGVRVANAINGVNVVHSELLQKTVGQVTRWMSANFTSKNPEFVVTNFLRDFGYAIPAYWMKGGNAGVLLKNMPKAFRAIHNDLTGKKVDSDLQKMYDEFKMNGGLTGYVHMQDVDSYKKWIERDIRRMSKDRTFGDVVLRNKAMRAGADLLEYLAQMSENSTRFAVFLSERQAGESVTEAAYAAKEITTNFNRKGRYSGMLGCLYGFFNATIQSSANALGLAKRSPGKFSVYCGSLIMLQALSSSLCRMFGGDDEIGENNYDRLADWVKYNNLVLPDLGKAGRFITIPLPHFFRALSSLGVIGGEVWNGVKTPGKGLEAMFDAVSGDLTPVEIATPQFKNLPSFLMSVTPTAFKPVTEAYAFNRNFMNLPISREAMGDQKKTLPQNKLAKKQTNPTLVSISKWLNEAGGGGEYTTAEIGYNEETGEVERNEWKTWMDVNPAKFEHVVEGIFGGRLKFFNNIYKTVDNALNGEFEASTTPVLRPLYQTPKGESAWIKFYEVRDEVVDIDAKASEFMKTGNYDAYGMINYRNARLVETYKAYETIVKSLNDALKMVSDPEQAAEIEKRRDDVVKEFAIEAKKLDKEYTDMKRKKEVVK